MCQHLNVKRHGFDRKGQQRLKCKDCGRTQLAVRRELVKHLGERYMANRISPQKEFQLVLAMCMGKTDRQITKELGVSNITINRRRHQANQLVIDPGKVPKGACRCDYCGQKIKGEREAYRLTRRTTRKFCSHTCYGNYQRFIRSKDRCKRCKRMRKEIGPCVVFSHGWCPKCYQVLRDFGFDEEAAALFELTQQLKKEVRHNDRKASR